MEKNIWTQIVTSTANYLMSELPDLSKEHKAIALKYHTEEDIGAIARRCFGDTDPETGARIDRRSKFAKAIRVFLAGESRTVTERAPTPDVVLTDEHKRQIEALAPKMRNGRTLELIRLVWGDNNLTPLSKQGRLVIAYLKEVYPEGVELSDEPVEEREWKPPISVVQLIGLVNTYVLQSDNRKTYNHVTLKPSEKKCLEALMTYMRSYKMKVAASKYEKQMDRELFLSSFIRWTHDKHDLTQIEVDQFILAAEEMVNIEQIGRSLQRIDKMHEEVSLGQVVDENGKRVKLGMTDVELINAVRTKHETAKKRLESLMENLEMARSERENERKNRDFSVLDLIDLWMQNAEASPGQGGFRDKQIEGGIQEKEQDAKEVERLSAEEETIALISGQSKGEARS